ncbi:MAG: hypothetical protein AAB866_00860 [Patescibacteria group bacterium]
MIKKLRKNNGQAMITSVIFFIFIVTTIVVGVSFAVLRQVKSGQNLINSKESYYIDEGVKEIEKFQLKFGQ